MFSSSLDIFSLDIAYLNMTIRNIYKTGGFVMKMSKIHILLAVLLLGNAIAMQGMTQQGKRVLKRPIYKPIYKKVDKSAPQPMPAPKPTTQTWGNWVRSLFYIEPMKPVEMNIEPEESYVAEEVAPSPFEVGGQKRMYSASSTPKASSWGDWVKSFFGPKELTPEEFAQKIDRLISGDQGKIDAFNENDFNKAKDEIGEMINQNPDYKSYVMSFGRYYRFKEETILDEVFCRIFDTLQRNAIGATLNYLKLAEYLVNQGVEINLIKTSLVQGEYYHEEWYKECYERSMKEYKALYWIEKLTDFESKLKEFDEIYKKLDPLLKKALSEATYRGGFIDKFQQERIEMEANKDFYREKFKDEKKRDTYVWTKLAYEDVPFDILGTTFNTLRKNFFNEMEYQDWLKSDDKSTEFFKKQAGEKRQGKGNRE